MVTCSGNNVEDKVCPEVELLNQACLDLVAQIEQLKEENAWLKKKAKEENGPGKSSGSPETG